ncbi:AbrB/MazE/SpoVT family DNA-binding domain-containing protein [Halorubrum miltondacostae]|uniref:AbrB/MazE/SpoVT family DNA-binding domain-containing protein n=1 Tax=Halorubrum miltondacostae TaxID=3076378 RepID=UPI003526DD76
MSKSTRVIEKGQATIPHELHEKYDLKPGDEVVWIDTDKGTVEKNVQAPADVRCSFPTPLQTRSARRS